MNKKNIESINAAIVAQIKGGFIPWVKDWKTDTGAFSHVTKKCYSELNSYIVGSGEYASYEQWKKEGFFPEKDTAKYIMLFKAWNPETKKIVDNSEAEADDENTIKNTKLFPVLRYYKVFSAENVRDKDGNKPELSKPTKLTIPATSKQIFEIAQKYSHAENCPISFERQDRAFYRPAEHSITLPMYEDFATIGGLFATMFHEIGHSTGKVLGRKISCFFGSPEYAQEELTAELTSAYICHELGIDNRQSMKNNAGYIQGWLRPLQNNLINFYKAAADAKKAAEYILKSGGYKTVEN